MIKLPNQYKTKIISMFGSLGENWLTNVPEVVDRYIKNFNLTNLRIHEDLSINLILYAECEEYGKIVLKIGLPVFYELIYREVKALEEFNGKNACKCYYSNLNDGIRILERLVPGETLNNVEDREERIKVFCEVALNLDVKFEYHIQLPSYREILDRSINQSKEQPEKFKILKELIIAADNLYKEIESKDLPKYLLHADLHHDNILTSSNGRKAIDPHGFLGEKVLETARFMENEIQKQEMSKYNILEIVNLMANYFNEDKVLICKVLFIDYVLSTCWDIEMNFSDEHINRDINNLKLILVCLDNILTEKDEKVTVLHFDKG